MKVADIKTIAVLGSGTMGQGIAQLFASAGYTTLLYDVDTAALENAVKKIANGLSDAVRKEKITALRAHQILELVRPTSEIAEVKADVIVEAIVENLGVKQQAFVQIEKINNGNAILATNTSSLSVTTIAAELQHPGRFLGMHFFNPAHLMRLVEIVAGEKTEPAIANLMVDFLTTLGKDPVRCGDTPGFIVNRVARHFYLESLAAFEQNAASIETIDALLRSAGFKMGPFELMDLIGIDINYAVSKSVYEAFENAPRFKPNPIQEQKVKAGKLGRKSGEGFYKY